MISIVCSTVAAAALFGVMSAGPAEDFTACMRAHGLPGFPDATVTPDGRILLEPGARAVDPFDADYRTALAVCADELPAGTELPVEPRPPVPPRSPVVPALADLPTPPEPPEVPAP